MARPALSHHHRRVLMWGAGIWALSAIIGIALAFSLERPFVTTIVTAIDAAVVLLLLPWFLGAVLSQQTRAGAMRANVQRTLLGGSHDTMHREAAEIMSGKQWVGDYETIAAQMALVVFVLDLALRLVLGAGWFPFPAL